VGGTTVYHNGSADLVDAALEGHSADVLLAGIAGWRYAPGYVERLVRILRPRLIVPTHYDFFFAPLEEGVRLLPGTSFERFLEECRRVAPGVPVVAPTPWEELLVSDGGKSFGIVSIGNEG
jgi:L-ascorbate metabolism protein UlaG (beta-lactamase superfamily)